MGSCGVPVRGPSSRWHINNTPASSVSWLIHSVLNAAASEHRQASIIAAVHQAAERHANVPPTPLSRRQAANKWSVNLLYICPISQTADQSGGGAQKDHHLPLTSILAM